MHVFIHVAILEKGKIVFATIGCSAKLLQYLIKRIERKIILISFYPFRNYLSSASFKASFIALYAGFGL
jgi:hypothetical protein